MRWEEQVKQVEEQEPKVEEKEGEGVRGGGWRVVKGQGWRS